MDDKTTSGLIYVLGIFNLGLVSLILWIVNKDKSEMIDRHGKNWVNMAINLIVISIGLGIIYIIGFGLMAADLGLFGGLFLFIAGMGYLVIGIYALVFSIKGAIKGFAGEDFIYPYVIQIIK